MIIMDEFNKRNLEFYDLEEGEILDEEDENRILEALRSSFFKYPDKISQQKKLMNYTENKHETLAKNKVEYEPHLYAKSGQKSKAKKHSSESRKLQNKVLFSKLNKKSPTPPSSLSSSGCSCCCCSSCSASSSSSSNSELPVPPPASSSHLKDDYHHSKSTRRPSHTRKELNYQKISSKIERVESSNRSPTKPLFKRRKSFDPKSPLGRSVNYDRHLKRRDTSTRKIISRSSAVKKPTNPRKSSLNTVTFATSTKLDKEFHDPKGDNSPLSGSVELKEPVKAKLIPGSLGEMLLKKQMKGKIRKDSRTQMQKALMNKKEKETMNENLKCEFVDLCQDDDDEEDDELILRIKALESAMRSRNTTPSLEATTAQSTSEVKQDSPSNMIAALEIVDTQMISSEASGIEISSNPPDSSNDSIFKPFKLSVKKICSDGFVALNDSENESDFETVNPESRSAFQPEHKHIPVINMEEEFLKVLQSSLKDSESILAESGKLGVELTQPRLKNLGLHEYLDIVQKDNLDRASNKGDTPAKDRCETASVDMDISNDSFDDVAPNFENSENTTERVDIQFSKPDVNTIPIEWAYMMPPPSNSEHPENNLNSISNWCFNQNMYVQSMQDSMNKTDSLDTWKTDTEMTESCNNNYYYPPTMQADNKEDSDLNVQNEYYLQCHQPNSEEARELRDNLAEQYKSFMSTVMSHNNCQSLASKKEQHRDLVKIHLEPSKAPVVNPDKKPGNGKRRGRRKRRSSRKSGSDETGDIFLNVSEDLTKSQSCNKNLMDDEDEDMLRAQLLNDMSIRNVYKTQEIGFQVGSDKQDGSKDTSSSIAKKTAPKSFLPHKKALCKDPTVGKEKKNKWLMDRKLINVTVTKKMSLDSNKEHSQLQGFSMSKFPPVKPVIISLNNESDSEAEHEETQKENFKDCDSVISGINSLIRSCRNKQSLMSLNKDSSLNLTSQRNDSSQNFISQRKYAAPTCTSQRKVLSLNLTSQRKDSALNLPSQRIINSAPIRPSQRLNSASNLPLQRKDLSLNLIQRDDSAPNLTSQRKDSCRNLILHRKDSSSSLISQRKAPISSLVVASQNSENLSQSSISTVPTPEISVRQPMIKDITCLGNEQQVENQRPNQQILSKQKDLPIESINKEAPKIISYGIIEHLSIKKLNAPNGEIVCPQTNLDECKIKMKSEIYDKDCEYDDTNRPTSNNSSEIAREKGELEIKLSSCTNEKLECGGVISGLEITEENRLLEIKNEEENINKMACNIALIVESSKFEKISEYHQDTAINNVLQDMSEDIRTSPETSVCVSEDVRTPPETSVCVSEEAKVSVLGDDEKEPHKDDWINLTPHTEDTNIHQKFDCTSMTQKFEDASRPQEIEDASRPQEIEDVSRPQEIEDASRPQEIEDASRPQEIEDASRPQEFENASTPQKIEDASKPQEVSSMIKVECDSPFEEVENTSILQESEGDGIPPVSSEDSSDSESDSSSSSSSSEDSESDSEDDEIKFKEDETKIKKETEISLRNKLLQKRQVFLQKENKKVSDKHETPSSFLVKPNEDQDCESNSLDMLKSSEILNDTNIDLKITEVENNNNKNEDCINVSKSIEFAVENVKNKSVSENEPKCTVHKNIVSDSTDASVINQPVCFTRPTPVCVTRPSPVCVTRPSPVCVTRPTPVCVTRPSPVCVTRTAPVCVTRPSPVCVTRTAPVCVTGTADSDEVAIDKPRVEENVTDNQILRNCKETESEVDKNKHHFLSSNKERIMLMSEARSSTVTLVKEKSLKVSAVLTNKCKETPSPGSFSHDIPVIKNRSSESTTSNSSKLPKSVLSDKSSKCKDWKLQESQVEKSISLIFGKVQDELNNKVSSVKTLSSQIVALIQKSMTDELQCQNIFKEMHKLLTQITWLHKTRKEKKLSISSNFTKVTTMMQKLNSDVNYLSRLETVVQKQYNVQGVPLLSSIKRSKQVGEIQRQNCFSEMNKLRAAVQRLGSQEFVLSKTLSKSLDNLQSKEAVVTQRKKQPFKLDNRIYKRQIEKSLENNSKREVIRGCKPSTSDCGDGEVIRGCKPITSDCGDAGEVTSVRSASCAKLIKLKSNAMPTSYQKADEPFENDKRAGDLILCPYGLLGRCNDDHCIYDHVSTADSEVSLPVDSSCKSKYSISDSSHLTNNSKPLVHSNENIQKRKLDNVKTEASTKESCNMEIEAAHTVNEREVYVQKSVPLSKEERTVPIQEGSKELDASQNLSKLTEVLPDAECHVIIKRRRCKKRKSVGSLCGTLKKRRGNGIDSCLSLSVKCNPSRSDLEDIDIKSSVNVTTTVDMKPICDQMLNTATVGNLENNVNSNPSVCEASNGPSAVTPRTRKQAIASSLSVPTRKIRKTPSVLARTLRRSRRTKRNLRRLRR